MRKSYLAFPLASCLMSFLISPVYATELITTYDDEDVANPNESSAQTIENDVEQLLSTDEVQRMRSLSKFGTGTYFGLGSTYDGSDLLINEPNLHKDLGLLEQNRFMNAHLGRIGDSGSRVQMSGDIAAAAQYHTSPAPMAEKSAIDASAEIDLAGHVNDYFTSYVKFAGSSDNSNFTFDQGFVVLGDLTKSPFYGTAGKMFLPSGDYSTYMITAPITRSLGRNKANAVVGGYFDPNVSGEVFAYQGVTKDGSRTQIDQWGVDVNLHPVPCPPSDMSFNIGGSYFNNMADADGIIPIVGSDNQLHHYVNAVNLNGKFGWGPLNMRAEYITALRSFAAADIPGATANVRPSAMNVEAAYTVPGIAKKTRLIAGYGRTWNSADLDIMQDQYGVSGSVSVLKNTIVALEVLHLVPFSGTADNVATLQVDLFF